MAPRRSSCRVLNRYRRNPWNDEVKRGGACDSHFIPNLSVEGMYSSWACARRDGGDKDAWTRTHTIVQSWQRHKRARPEGESMRQVGQCLSGVESEPCLAANRCEEHRYMCEKALVPLLVIRRYTDRHAPCYVATSGPRVSLPRPSHALQTAAHKFGVPHG